MLEHQEDSSRATIIRDNITRIRERMETAAIKAGRNPADIALLAVTKFHPLESVRVAYDAGLRLFGENRVQEASDKYADFRQHMPDARLHMIGTLQKNKVNKSLDLFDAIQSVDSTELLEAILVRLERRLFPLALYFELHTGEESKSGFPDTDALLHACDMLAEHRIRSPLCAKLVRLEGLMTMAPFTDDPVPVRASFSMLRKARELVRARFPELGCEGLSMGMSNDFELAIEEGSTLVRIGTAIFGPRA